VKYSGTRCHATLPHFSLELLLEIAASRTTGETQQESLPCAEAGYIWPTARTGFLQALSHRMLGVRRDLCGSSSPTPCRSRVTYRRLHRALSRQVLNISREGDSTTSLGSQFQCSVTLRVKKLFLMFRRNFMCFSLCPLPLVLSLGTTEKSLAPSSCHTGWFGRHCLSQGQS